MCTCLNIGGEPPARKKRLRKIASGSDEDMPAAAGGGDRAESDVKENVSSDVEMEGVHSSTILCLFV